MTTTANLYLCCLDFVSVHYQFQSQIRYIIIVRRKLQAFSDVTTTTNSAAAAATTTTTITTTTTTTILIITWLSLAAHYLQVVCVCCVVWVCVCCGVCVCVVWVCGFVGVKEEKKRIEKDWCDGVRVILIVVFLRLPTLTLNTRQSALVVTLTLNTKAHSSAHTDIKHKDSSAHTDTEHKWHSSTHTDTKHKAAYVCPHSH